MAWLWGSKNDDDEYDSDEYTDGEYSGEEYDEELTDDEADDVEDDDQAEADGDGEDDAEKEDGKEAVQENEGDEKEATEEEDEESYVEVTEEDAASAAAKVADVEQAEKQETPQETPEDLRSNSLLDAASIDEAEAEDEDDVESASSIVEESKDINTQTDVVPSAVADDSADDDTDDSDDEDDKPPSEVQTSSVPVETVSSDDESFSDDDDDSDDDEEELSSFADKQSMIFLAAEHDRVDILQGILTEETEEDKHAFMTTGIPPLHVAISFGSIATTQSLLRMGADPSIRPNIDEVKKHYQSNESKAEIKNMGRFDGISAWELAFGNEAYAKLEASGATKRSSWMFASAIKPVGGDDNDEEEEDPVICPLDNIPPNKREGILHAFTAEALRCLGGDELDRLKELLNSGMPATTEIADKDLYQWAVEMGAMNCEEHLRPTEAAKHAADDEEKANRAAASEEPKTASQKEISNARVLDRPGDETTCSQLRNKLVELDSLASALSTCVDNLAEEVSVCHGLLLMNGGASALASHVKSLKAQKQDKEDELSASYDQLDASEQRLSAMVKVSGSLGKEVLKLSDTELKQQQQGEESAEADNVGNSADSETERNELLGQIDASETKIRKLRVSITDLSEESARDLKEVERRGLSGGIDLVRNLREEIREVEFQLAEAKSLNGTCQAKIRLIKARAPPKTKFPPTPTTALATATAHVATKGASEEAISVETYENEEEGSAETEEQRKTPSQKIATGDSQAIALRAPGKQGFFRIDLWQVLLRIIGMDRAADRRALDVTLLRKKDLAFSEKRPEPIHVMTV